MKNYTLTIQGYEGIFNTEKYVTFFPEHETTESFKANLQSIKKEITTLYKTGDVMVTVSSSDREVYGRNSLYRFILNRYTTDLDVRKYNGYDFSDRTVYTFVDMKDTMKYLMKQLKEIGLDTMEELPEKTSRFSQKLNEKYDNVEI